MNFKKAIFVSSTTFVVLSLFVLVDGDEESDLSRVRSAEVSTRNKALSQSTYEAHGTSTRQEIAAEFSGFDPRAAEELKRTGLPVKDPILSPANWERLSEDRRYIAALAEEAVQSRDMDRRILAIAELAFQSSFSEAVETCRFLLTDPEPEVQESAILAITSLRDLDSLAYLREMAEHDPSEQVRKAAKKAVSELKRIQSLED